MFGPGCRLLAVTDPLGHTTRFTYDARQHTHPHRPPGPDHRLLVRRARAAHLRGPP
ncbi:RHS repeat domain-containing protein [Streptomyces atroolivaceus]